MATTHDLQLRAILDTSLVKQQIQALNALNSVNLDTSGIANSLNTLNLTIAKFTSSLEKLSQSTSQASQNIKQSTDWGRLGKFAAGMAVRKIGSATSEYFDATGNETGSQAVGFLGKVGGGALAGSAAGPYGALAGGVLGVIEGVFDILTENARKAAESLENFQKALEAARQKDLQYSQWEEARDISQMIRRGDKGELQETLSKGTSDYLAAQNTVQSFKEQFGDIATALAYIESLKLIKTTKRSEYTVTSTTGASYTYATDVVDEEKAKAVRDEIAAIEASIKDYEKAQDASKYLYAKNQQLTDAIDKLTNEEKAEADRIEKERAKKEAEDKKLAELNQKRIDALGKSEQQIFDKERLQQIVKDKDFGAILEELTRRQYLSLTAYEQYKRASSEGRADEAEQYFKEWTENRGYSKQLQAAQTLLYVDQYSDLISQLNQAIQPKSPVSDLLTQGISMGWIDESTENIDSNVEKISTKLNELVNIIRSQSRDTGVYI